MNDQSAPEAAAAMPEPQPQAETQAPPPRPRSFTQAVAEGFRSARADAERAARAAAPKMKAVCGQAAYDVSYVSAFGAFFGFAMLREILPDAVKDGFSAGAKRGQRAAEDVAASATAPEAEAAPATAA